MTRKGRQTFGKVTREREKRERRARKLEKKQAAAAERQAQAAGGTTPALPADDQPMANGSAEIL
jgi:hypothetical protein